MAILYWYGVSKMKYLKQLRKERGVSGEMLGNAINVSKYTVYNWEAGRRDPSLSDLVAIAEYFDVSIDCLVRGEEKEPPTKARERLADATYDALATLSPEAREIALAVLNALQQAQKQEGQNKKARE